VTQRHRVTGADLRERVCEFEGWRIHLARDGAA